MCSTSHRCIFAATDPEHGSFRLRRPGPCQCLEFVSLWNGFRRFQAALPPLLRVHFGVRWYMRTLGVALNNAFRLDVPGDGDVAEVAWGDTGVWACTDGHWGLSQLVTTLFLRVGIVYVKWSSIAKHDLCNFDVFC